MSDSRIYRCEHSGFVTQDPATVQLLSITAKVAPSEASVLIQGESGTGKELIAKRIHRLSPRSQRALISVNCGAIQDTLLLSELFGHEKGSFTGAVSQKQGLVELADKGTLFLDEIGEMGLDAQAKLLRFLQEGEVYRVGGNSPIRIDVRIISATNRDLESQVKAGKFREDLYYRINTVSLRIAPLRKRTGDIPLLLNTLIKEDHPASNTVPQTFSPKSLDILSRYAWPGNVRELRNLIERIRILVDSNEIKPDDLPSNFQPCLDPSSVENEAPLLLLSLVERRHIIRTLSQFNGNKTRAAEAMGITVKTLYNKLALYEREAATPQPPSARM